jgi:ABC-type transport system substrate-binding protein
MAEAGYPDGFPDRDFDLVYNVGADWDQISEAIQADLAPLGININIVGLERALYEERRSANDFDLFALNFLRTEPSQIAVPYFHSSQTPNPNVMGYDGADDLIDAARFEPDDDLRREYYHDFQRKVIEDMPVVPLLFPLQVVASQPNVSGMEIGLLDYPVWQMTIRSS